MVHTWTTGVFDGEELILESSDHEYVEFYWEQLPRLRRYLARRINSRETREDLEITTMMLAWQRFDLVPPDQRSFGWLASIAGGVLTNERRSEFRRRRLTERIQSHYLNSQDENLSAISALDGLEPAVEVALALLSDDEREVLLLHDLDECSYQDIACALGVNEAAARKRVTRARKRFTDHYNTAYGSKGGRHVE